MTGFTAAVGPTVPSPGAGITDALSLLVLLSEFAMLRSALPRTQVRLYAFQSLCVTGLAIDLAVSGGVPEAYAVAGISFLIKVVVIPLIVLRLLVDVEVEVAGSERLKVATMTFAGIVLAGFGLVVARQIRLPVSGWPAASPGVSLAMATAAVLVAFLLVIMRGDVVSQAIGFFALENAVSVASLVLASRLPLLAEIAFLFDLLVAVVFFGVLMRAHHGRARTLFTDVLDRLRG
ncbi:MAG: hydrogenase [Acidimicrobiales bacterium]